MPTSADCSSGSPTCCPRRPDAAVAVPIASVRSLLGAVALTLVTAVTSLPMGTASSYAEDPSPSASPTDSQPASPNPNDDAPAQILVTKLAPRAPTDPDEFLQVKGTITNRGSQPLHE